MPALPDDNGVALADAETRRHMRRDVAVPLLVPAPGQQAQRAPASPCKCGNKRTMESKTFAGAQCSVPCILLDVVCVVAAHDNCAAHFCRLHDACRTSPSL